MVAQGLPEQTRPTHGGGIKVYGAPAQEHICVNERGHIPIVVRAFQSRQGVVWMAL